MTTAKCAYCLLAFDPAHTAKGSVSDLGGRSKGGLYIKDTERYCGFVAGHTQCLSDSGRFKCCDAALGQSWGCRIIVFPHSAKPDASRDAAMAIPLDPITPDPPKKLRDIRPCTKCREPFDIAAKIPVGGIGNLDKRNMGLCIADTSRYCEFMCEHTQNPVRLFKKADNLDQPPRIHPCCGAAEGQSHGCRCVVLPHYYVPRALDQTELDLLNDTLGEEVEFDHRLLHVEDVQKRRWERIEEIEKSRRAQLAPTRPAEL